MDKESLNQTKREFKSIKDYQISRSPVKAKTR